MRLDSVKCRNHASPPGRTTPDRPGGARLQPAIRSLAANARRVASGSPVSLQTGWRDGAVDTELLPEPGHPAEAPACTPHTNPLRA